MERSGSRNSNNKKRKINNKEDDADDLADLDDEEKMEKFFALINNIREGRHRLTSGLDDRKKIKSSEGGEKSVGVWMPSFQREDFMDETAQKLVKVDDDPPVTLAATPNEEGNIVDQRHKGGGEEETKEIIDLRLSL